jgi:hypothetical protein
VRYSVAKGLARISERLPTDFADQVFETITGLFGIHSPAAASLYDLPTIAESTWHGACLASAEMARRGLVTSNRLPELIGWLSKVPILIEVYNHVLIIRRHFISIYGKVLTQ